MDLPHEPVSNASAHVRRVLQHMRTRSGKQFASFGAHIHFPSDVEIATSNKAARFLPSPLSSIRHHSGSRGVDAASASEEANVLSSKRPFSAVSSPDDSTRSGELKPPSPGSVWMGAPPLPRHAANSLAAFSLDAIEEDEDADKVC